MNRPSLIAYGLLGLVAATYVAQLDLSPVYLVNDEVFGAIQTLSLVATGRSVGGEFLPVYFRGLEFPPGRDPLCIYVTALFLKALPISEVSLRLPTALLGVSNIVLVWILGQRLWGRRSFSMLTAALLAMTPAHFILSRIAIPTLWSVPWLLGWLIGLSDYVESRRPKALFIAMLCLGMAIYGYLGTAMIVPLYFAGTIAFLFFSLAERSLRPYVVLIAGFTAPLCFLAYWQLVHPERWTELFDYYMTGSTVMNHGTPLLTASGVPNFAAIQERVTAYWNYFDPSFLFLAGDDSPRYSTGRAGVFLLSAAVFLPLGIYRAAHHAGIGKLLVYCFFATPITAALGGQIQIQRVLPLVAFGSLISAWGAVWLISHPTLRLRRVGLMLSVCAALQFVAFTADYFGHYRLRSGASRGGNLRGAFEEVIEASKERDRPVLYLSENVDNIEAYWRFYAVALGGANLEDRVRVVPPSELSQDDVPNGALFISGADEVPGREKDDGASSSWQLRRRIYELDGPTFYSVYENVR